MPPGLNISSVCRSPPPRCSSDAPPPLRLGRFFLPWHLLRARSLARSLACSRSAIWCACPQCSRWHQLHLPLRPETRLV